MISSGTKRGLAYSAVTALAVAGLPFMAVTANAEPLSSQVPNADSVRLVNPSSGAALSSKPDGQNSTYRLSAIAGSNASHMRFEYDLAGGGNNWVEIATVSTRNDDGAFAYEWNPDALGAQAGMKIRAVGYYIDNNAQMTTGSDTFSGATIDDTAASANLTDGSAKGYFKQPYAGEAKTRSLTVVEGTTSSNTGVDVRHWTGSGWSAFTGYGTPGSAFKGIYDVTGFGGLAFGPPDHLLLQAQNASSDTESYSMYEQQIETVTATATNTNSPTETVTVTVKDQQGNPIAGAQVLSSAYPGAVPEYTDANGEATFTQDAEAANDAFYYANGNDNKAWEPDTLDRRSAGLVQVRNYEAHSASLVAASRNGAAFDRDELDQPGDADVRVQVKDQMDNNYNPTGAENQDLEYYWLVTPFNTDLEPVRVPGVAFDSVTTEAGGQFQVSVPTNQEDGTYELFAGLTGTPTNDFAVANSKVLSFKMGDSDIVFDKASPQRSTSGGSEVVSGRLELGDGTGLPGRPLNASVNYVGAGNSKFDMPTGPDLASKDVVTDANGAFSVTLDDPDNNPPSTEKADVLVQTLNWVHNGDTDNALENATQRVEFIFSANPALFTSTITTPDSNLDGGADGATNGDPSTAGKNVSILYTLETPDDPNMQGDQSARLTNEPVTLTTTNGYFTNGAGDNLGTEETYTTDGQGQFTALLTITRDVDFDDDGRVNDIVTATAAGAVTDTQPVYFTSENPLSLSKVDVEFAAAQYQTTSNLPKAQARLDDVQLTVKAFDGFGNRSGRVPVNLSDSTVQTYVDGSTLTDYDEQPDAAASADSGVDQIVRVQAMGQQDTITINWYGVAVTNTTTTIKNSANGNSTVGQTVTETVTVVDQFGQPVNNYEVEFVRSGPNPQVGDVNYTTKTNKDGVATYNFVGDTKGTAQISAVVRDLDGTQVAKVYDSVIFTGGTTTPENPPVVTPPVFPDLDARLRAKGHGKRADVLTLRTNLEGRGSGVRVRFFRLVKGKRVFIESGILGPNGGLRIKVRDRNGNKKTTYIAKVVKSAVNPGKFTNKKRVR